MNYEQIKLLQDAIYLINHIAIGFEETSKIEELQGTRVSPNSPETMVRVFLPEYCRDLADKIIKQLEAEVRKHRGW